MKESLYRKYLVCSLVFVLTMGLVIKPASAAENFDINAPAGILIDADTGKILYQKESETVLGIASMTKMMTEYILLEAIKAGKVNWEQEYLVSPELSQMSHNNNLSNVYLRVDEKYKIKDLYAAMAIESANAATIAIAETIAGSEAKFVELMNKKGKELGLENYKFVNSTGLNNRDLLAYFPEVVGGADEENVMTPKDVARLAYHLLKDYPEVLDTSSVPEMIFAQGTRDEFLMDNWNWALEGYKEIADSYPNFQQYVYDGLDGLKTGSTPFAGYNFTGTASRDGQRFISVIMKTDSQGARFIETRKILDYGFNNFNLKEIIPKHYQVKSTKAIPVLKGKEDQVNIHTKSAISMVVTPGEEENYQPVLVLDEKKINKNGELTAPVKKGDKVGYLTIESKTGEKLSFVTDEGQKSIQVDVIAAEDVEKSNWFVLMMRGIGGFFGDLWSGVSSTVKGWF